MSTQDYDSADEEPAIVMLCSFNGSTPLMSSLKFSHSDVGRGHDLNESIFFDSKFRIDSKFDSTQGNWIVAAFFFLCLSEKLPKASSSRLKNLSHLQTQVPFQ